MQLGAHALFWQTVPFSPGGQDVQMGREAPVKELQRAELDIPRIPHMSILGAVEQAPTGTLPSAGQQENNGGEI